MTLLQVKTIKEKMQQNQENFPKMYMACGTEDVLIDNNGYFRDFLIENGVELTYV